MDRFIRLLTRRTLVNSRQSQRNVSLKYVKKSPENLKRIYSNIDRALDHFDGHYSRVYKKHWPSIRLGLLSPRKYCAILNTFVDHDSYPEGAIDVQKYYLKRLNNEAATEQTDEPPVEIQPQPETNVLSEDEANDSEPEGDLAGMFKEKSVDDEDQLFHNQASTNIGLGDYVPTSELIFYESVPSDPVYYEGTIRDVDENIQTIDHPPLTFQEHLKILTFPRGNWSRFEPPSLVPAAGLHSYYLVDGASILPVLVMDPKFDDVCADYCAAPGGKSLALVMTLKAKYILCNDLSRQRLRRLHSIVHQYIPDIKYAKSVLNFSNKDASKLIHPDTFDKILVDVPCSNDRNSVESVENNIFKTTRTEERLSLPSNQCDILKAALKSLKLKGDVVYSTCTLSPAENDNVIKRALLQLREEGFRASYAVMNLRETLKPFNRLFAISDKFSFGQQIVPNVCSNFGPMYISKIRRVE